MNPRVGEPREIARDLDFDGDERPRTLQRVEGGFLLQSSQNLMLVGDGGEVVFHTYYRAPGPGFLSKLAVTALSSAINAGVGAAVSSAAGGFVYVPGPTSALPYWSTKYRSTTSAEEYTYMLADIKKGEETGPGVVKVNRQTGETVAEIVLGEKSPTYRVDPVESRLYYVEHKKSVVCYGL